MIINVSLPTGVMASYWRTTSATVNLVDRSAEVMVQGWLNEAAFTNNLAPVTSRTYTVQLTTDAVAGLNTFLAATIPALLAQG